MQKFTFQQIEYFLKVAEHQSITKAASELYVSQPAVSRTVQAFEENIGFPLFSRNSQGIFLTDEGKYIYLAIRPLYDSFFRVLSNASTIANMAPKFLHIAISSTIYFSRCYQLVRQLLDAFMKENPNYSITESILDDSSIRNNITITDLHVAFCDEFALRGLSGIACIPIAQLFPYVVMSVENPLSKCETITPEQLNGKRLSFVVDFTSSTQRNEYCDYCISLGIVPEKVKYPPNYISLIHAIQLNKGLGIQFDVGQPPAKEGIVCRPLTAFGTAPRLVAAWADGGDFKSARYFGNEIKKKIK